MMPRPRQESPTGCPAGYRYYDCAANPFRGCCSIDPCGLHKTCPVKNQPGFLNSPDTMASSTASSAPPASTSQQTLHATVTVDAMAPGAVTLAPTAITAPGATSSTRSPSHSASSSSAASKPSGSPEVGHTGRTAGLVVGLVVGLIIMAAMFWGLWRRCRQRKGVEAGQRFILMKKLRKESYHLPQGTSGLAPLIPADTNKPVPPVPAYAAPWQDTLTEAGHGRDGLGEQSPTDPHLPRAST